MAAQKTGNDISVDYQESFEYACVRAAEAILMSDKDLQILSFCSSCTTNWRKNGPSWVPNFAGEVDIAPLALTLHRKDDTRPRREDDFDNVPFQYDREDKILTLRGVNLGAVSNVYSA